MIAYEQYENMDRRQLLNSLIVAEKKLDALQNKFTDQKNLIAFIKSKLKASLDNPKYNFVAYKKTELHKKWENYTPEKKAEIEARFNELEKDEVND